MLYQVCQSSQVFRIGQAADGHFQGKGTLTGLAIGDQNDFKTIVQNHMAVIAMVKGGLNDGVSERAEQAQAQHQAGANAQSMRGSLRHGLSGSVMGGSGSNRIGK